jgi:chromate transporter
VENYGWLAPGEMLDGLGLAETTPGPLILVTEFVGYLAAFRAPAPFEPITAGVMGAALTIWVTFVPCFVWIFLGAPYVERIGANKQLSAALSCITAAVVGVVLNLSVWFGLHVLFAEVATVSGYGVRLLLPAWSSLQPVAALLSLLAALALLRFKFGMAATLGLCGGLGLVWGLISG